jgi:hypothetical protein
LLPHYFEFIIQKKNSHKTATLNAAKYSQPETISVANQPHHSLPNSVTVLHTVRTILYTFNMPFNTLYNVNE